MERDTHVGGTTCLYLTPALESTSSLDEDHSSLVGGNKVWKEIHMLEVQPVSGFVHLSQYKIPCHFHAFPGHL